MTFLTVLAIIILVAVLLIVQANQTPASIARYGLDQAEHGHEEAVHSEH